MYYGGLDMGTSSVGWALTDEQYRLIRKKGKDLWGVRLFDEAKTAEERRMHRTARRRRARETARIGILKEYFIKEIEKTDPGFYQRLEESKYHFEDRTTKERYSLFADENYTDQQYFQDYPTIFHLRKALLKGTAKQDVRLVYLAILNLFKHRGNFLHQGIGREEEEETIKDSYPFFVEALEQAGIHGFPHQVDDQQIEEILSSKEKSKSEKAEQLGQLLGITKKEKACYELVKMICGLSGKLSMIWDKELLGIEYGKKQVSFSSGNSEEDLANLGNLLPAEDHQILEWAKRIHDQGVLSHLLKGHHFLAEAKVEDYEKHKADLKKLKLVIKKYCPEEYDTYFRTMTDNNYSGYVGSVNTNSEKKRRNREAKKEQYKAFWKETKRLLDAMPKTDELVVYLNREWEKGSLLPKQRTYQNGVIPNQLPLKELKKILANAQKELPFLGEKDDSGLTVSERIIQLFSFTIPYYVGPLYRDIQKAGNQWVVRRDPGKVLPWNIEQKVNLEETRAEFIARMVGHCTYLNGERVLPKNSLLYEKFMVLNELNNVKIYGEKLSVDLKQKIYRELFQKGKKVSFAHFLQFLQLNGQLKPGEKDGVSGINQNFQQTLTAYGRFYSVIGEEINQWEKEKMAERIIFQGTVFSNDKKMMKAWLEKEYGEQANKPYLTTEQIKKILGFKWKDWGRLSEEFLLLPGYVNGFAQEMSLIDALWNTPYNLMELLSSSCTYWENLNQKIKRQEKYLQEFTYEDLEESYLSAPVKRMVWQTILILKELVEVMGEPPERLFIEMPRAEGEKKQTISRKKRLEDLYKQCRKDGKVWLTELAGRSEDELRSKKLYLYYAQKGRCMYTGNRISLEDLLANHHRYDIDHIYPRHYVKDDHLENNLVLVEKESNQYKSDRIPIDANIQNRCMDLWRELREGGFISAEKFNRLTRKTEFSEEELAGFINRQIVETGQATKYIANLLEELLPETEIVYVKAANVSKFRKTMSLLKARSLNDFHHANDAYLNIVVGNTYYTKFTKNPIHFIREQKREPYHMDKLFQYDVCRNGQVAWKAGSGGTICTVKRMMNRYTPLVTKRTFEAHGGLADQTIYSAEEVRSGNLDCYIPIKQTDSRLADPEKYGGFNSVTGTYYFLVEHEKKKKRVRTIEVIPLYLKEELTRNSTALENYCRETLKLVHPQIRLEKIPRGSLIKRNGYYLFLAGRTGNNLCAENAVQLCLMQKWNNYIYRLEKFKEQEKEEDFGKEHERITKERNGKLFLELFAKHSQTIYQKKPNPLGIKLVDKESVFQQLSLKEQTGVLLELLKVTQSHNPNVQIKELDVKSSPIKISKEVLGQEEFLLIYQSITGIYQSAVDLKTI